MRVKTLKIVMAFRTTYDAMETEYIMNNNNIKGRLIPVPREITAGCGVAWCMTPEDYDAIPYEIKTQLPEAEKIVKLMV